MTRPPKETPQSRPAEEDEPTARRRQLGFRLLALREQRGMTAERAGELAGLSKATVSRYERAKGNVRWGHVEMLCRAYEAPAEEREALVDLAKNSKVKDGWWVPYAGKLAQPMRLLIAVEDEATRISQHTVGVIPGLLQTMEYARAIKATPGHELSDEALDEYLFMRRRRQQILDRASPPRYQVVLDEAVIRRSVGGPDVMSAQLSYLLERGHEPNITIQVLPFSAGICTAAVNSFIVYGGSDPSLDVTFVENQVGTLVLEEDQARKEFASAIAFLRHEALDPVSSAAMIAEASKSHLRHRN
ncbi:helix-turn-helix domain-containing protein [Streptomyces jumonjinensis]|uniref:Helix-turn-helix domain-containing protein n=2 Tax=Streptomyces jumonjinensis TaxID=1945 RepID=A0A646KR94_STRJU|nr:helix-turn-helix transcriptional regulator [Streptomyces jumonjinensis]MQT04822.1 helix-turn-helix domain-containing protein [Streptomyces jumonjinensis]